MGIQLSRRSLNPQSGRAAPGGQNLWSDTQGRPSAGWRWAGVGERWKLPSHPGDRGCRRQAQAGRKHWEQHTMSDVTAAPPRGKNSRVE